MKSGLRGMYTLLEDSWSLSTYNWNNKNSNTTSGIQHWMSTRVVLLYMECDPSYFDQNYFNFSKNKNVHFVQFPIYRVEICDMNIPHSVHKIIRRNRPFGALNGESGERFAQREDCPHGQTIGLFVLNSTIIYFCVYVLVRSHNDSFKLSWTPQISIF